MIGTSRARTLVGVVKKQVGDLRLDYGNADVNETLRGKAKQLRMLGVRRVKPYAGGISDSDKKAAEADSDRVKPHFVIGQFDHPGIGINTTSTF